MSFRPLSDDNFTVRDNHHHKLTTSSVLGRGGQGVVYRVKENPLLAVKLLYEPLNNQFRPKNNAYDQRLQQLDLYPIDPQLHLALPWAYLEDYAGYVMPLLEDVQSIGPFLTAYDVQDYDEYFAVYQQLPLRKRLEILLQLSSILAQLHAKDLVFGDLSANNVLVSKIQGQPQVWLIDVDNVSYMGAGTSAHTLSYAAPEFFINPNAELNLSLSDAGPAQELSQKQAQKQTQDPTQFQSPPQSETNPAEPTQPYNVKNTVYTDAFSFSVLAFELLTLERPLTETDYEDENQCGTWIYAPWLTEQEINRELHSILLTPELFCLFDRTLGATKPQARAPLWLWHAALQRALDLTIECPECHMHYYASFDACPICDSAQPPVLQVYSLGKLVFARELCACELSTPISLWRHLWGPCPHEDEAEVYTISKLPCPVYSSMLAPGIQAQGMNLQGKGLQDKTTQGLTASADSYARTLDETIPETFNLQLRLQQASADFKLQPTRTLTRQELEQGFSLSFKDQVIELKGVWPCALTK